MSVSPYETLIVETRGPVGWLLFNRPAELNALNHRMAEELPRAWAQLDQDSRVRVIVNGGIGRAFQTGLDMKQTARLGLGAEGGPPRYTGRANKVRKPVICAVNGLCAGMGLLFVVDSDTVIASADASFFDPHVSVGQVSALEPIGLLGRMPFSAVMRMVLMGREERIAAQRAYELGLVSELIPATEDFAEGVQRSAELMAKNSLATMVESRRAVWDAVDRQRREDYRHAHSVIRAFWGHPDNIEGPRAFADKRPPVWAALDGEHPEES